MKKFNDGWVTLKSNEKRKGQKVLLDEDGNIMAGMGGKFNGKHISSFKESGNKETTNSTESARASLNKAKERKEAAGAMPKILGREDMKKSIKRQAEKNKWGKLKLEKKEEASKPKPKKEQPKLEGSANANHTGPTYEEKIKARQEMNKAIKYGEIDTDGQNRYNLVNHMGAGRDFNKEFNIVREQLISKVFNEQGGSLVETKEQQAKAKELISKHLEKEEAHINRTIANGANNPSWFITGRGGRNMAKANRANERESDRISKHIDDQEKDVNSIIKTLASMKTGAAKAHEAFTKASNNLRNYISDIANAHKDPNGRNFGMSVKQLRALHAPKAYKEINKMIETKGVHEARQYLQKADSVMKEHGGMANGLFDVFSPRTNAGKRIKEVLATGGEHAK